MEIIKTQFGRSIQKDYRPQVPYHTAPKIECETTNEDGEAVYVLANGNTIPVVKYDSMWKKAKGVVNRDKKYKGDNPDKTRDFLNS